MARAYLCSGCGQVMGRMLGICPLCGSKNLVFYDSDRSAALLERQRQIQGRRTKQSTPVQAYLIVLAGLSVFMGAGYLFTNYWDDIVSHPVVRRTIALIVPATAGSSSASTKAGRQSQRAVAASGQSTH